MATTTMQSPVNSWRADGAEANADLARAGLFRTTKSFIKSPMDSGATA
jgi:hypothetical protein